ncbi:MAG: DUF4262 domain-containing protein [Candidatus Nanopelagicales bacterium]
MSHRSAIIADERRALARVRREIDRRGWASAEGCVIVDESHVATDYTVGLTRHHGHPEIVIVDGSYVESRRILARLAHEVAMGTRFEPCLLDIDGVRYGLLAVEDPAHLWLAHLMYARDGLPVSALQVVAPSETGLLPWESGEGQDLLLGAWPF